MGGRYGGNIKGKRVNRNGPSSGQRKKKDWNTTLGSLIPNFFPNPQPNKETEVKDVKETRTDAQSNL
jgi:hypothetical protein